MTDTHTNLGTSVLHGQEGRIRRVALALEGGGSLGSFQVGVLKNLYRRGLEPVIVTATSVGALNAAKIAEGRGQAGMNDLEDLWTGLDGSESIYIENPRIEHVADNIFAMSGNRMLEAFGWSLVFRFDKSQSEIESIPGAVTSDLASNVSGIESFYLQDPLINLVRANVRPDVVANSGIKLRLSAVAQASGELRYFTELGDLESVDGIPVRDGRISGPLVNDTDHLLAPNLADAVLASSAIPLIFKPWLVQGGEYYWDGAVRETVPIQKALELGATDLVVILTGPGPWTKQPELWARRFALVIEHVHQIDDPDPPGGMGDYFVQVRAGHDWKKSPVREDTTDFYPHWIFPNVFGDIDIEVWDDESSPDQCDVSPVHGKKGLHIVLGTDSNTISGDIDSQVGDLITVTGAGDQRRVRISFRIVAYDSGSSYATVLPKVIQVTPLVRVLQLLDQIYQEAIAGDYAVLDTLDVLHTMAASSTEGIVLNAFNSKNAVPSITQGPIPLPLDLSKKAYALPRYVVIEPPYPLGALTDFDHNIILFNIKVGEIVAKYTRVGFLDALDAPHSGGHYTNPTQDPALNDNELEGLRLSAIARLFTSEIERFHALANAGDGAAEVMHKYLVKKQREFNDMRHLAARRSRLDILDLPSP